MPELDTLGPEIADIVDAVPDTNLMTDAERAKLEDLPSGDINTKTDNYTLQLSDAGKVLEMNHAASKSFTVPANASVAFEVETQITLVRYGAGAVPIVAAPGVTIRAAGNLEIAAQYAAATLYKRGTNEWVLVGNLVQP